MVTALHRPRRLREPTSRPCRGGREEAGANWQDNTRPSWTVRKAAETGEITLRCRKPPIPSIPHYHEHPIPCSTELLPHCLTQIVTLRKWLSQIKCYRKLVRRPRGRRHQQDGEAGTCGGGPAAASQSDTASLGAPSVDSRAMAELTPDFPSPGPASAHTLSQPLFETLCVAPPVWA